MSPAADASSSVFPLSTICTSSIDGSERGCCKFCEVETESAVCVSAWLTVCSAAFVCVCVCVCVKHALLAVDADVVESASPFAKMKLPAFCWMCSCDRHVSEECAREYCVVPAIDASYGGWMDWLDGLMEDVGIGEGAAPGQSEYVASVGRDGWPWEREVEMARGSRRALLPRMGVCESACWRS